MIRLEEIRKEYEASLTPGAKETSGFFELLLFAEHLQKLCEIPRDTASSTHQSFHETVCIMMECLTRKLEQG